MRQLTVILTALTVAAVQSHAGILDWLLGSRDDNAATIEWMVAYWEDNANHYAISKEDALRLANACVQYDRNPKRRFVEMIASTEIYGSIVGDAFHSYDPGTRMLADPEAAAKLLILMTQQGDISNGNFLEKVRVPKQQNAAAVEATASPPPPSDQQPNLPDKAAAKATPPPQFVTITQSVSVGAVELPARTRLEFVSKEGSDVHIRYRGVEYAIPISATNLK